MWRGGSLTPEPSLGMFFTLLVCFVQLVVTDFLKILL